MHEVRYQQGGSNLILNSFDISHKKRLAVLKTSKNYLKKSTARLFSRNTSSNFTVKKDLPQSRVRVFSKFLEQLLSRSVEHHQRTVFSNSFL